MRGMVMEKKEPTTLILTTIEGSHMCRCAEGAMISCTYNLQLAWAVGIVSRLVHLALASLK